MMQYQVMNAQQARRYAMGHHKNSAIIISIQGTDDPGIGLPVNKKNQVKAVCRVLFDDVTDGPGTMTDADGRCIAEFVTRFQDQVDTCIIHCGAGISRSAGVCAAILKWATGDDTAIFQNPHYVPNMRCYQIMLNALIGAKSAHECEQT